MLISQKVCRLSLVAAAKAYGIPFLLLQEKPYREFFKVA
jgi:hypothetical protein